MNFRKIFNSIQAKILFTVLTILIQLAVLVGMFRFLGDYFSWFYTIMLILSMLAVAYIVTRDNKVEYKMIWIILALSFPVFGGLLYVMFWRGLFTGKQKKHYEKILDSYTTAMTDNSYTLDLLKSKDRGAHRQSQYIKKATIAKLYQNTEMEYFKLGEDMFEAMLEELRKAEKYIFIEYFIIQNGHMWDSIEKILEEKADQGVDVRVMYDYFGCLLTLPPDFDSNLQSKGISCVAFNKFTHIFNSNFNTRNHRKLCIIDGNVGFTGGVNLADEYINAFSKYGHWKDTAIMLKGEAVYGLTTMFLAVWNAATHTTDDYSKYTPTKTYKCNGFVQPFTDSPADDELVGERLYMSILNQAVDYVYITTPYLIISNDMITALQTAALSGVDVRIMLPGIADKKMVHFLSRSYYETLIKSGVRIYEYTPGFIHSKMFVSDDKTSVVGTINLDYRSLALHYECAAWIYDSSVVYDVKDDFIETLKSCKEITDVDVQRSDKLSFAKFIMLSILRIFAPLM